ncbi:MAG TPA: redoxin domain-containing protein [Candidatus Acidoferrales bacterium]|nr:redoxin domain-containing protein [Candidatus Acidoferrales bacterium]
MRPVFLALALAATTAAATLPVSAATAPEPAPAVTRAGGPMVPLGLGSEYAIVDEGSQAPDFAFESEDGWRRLHDLRAAGHVLLVFAPDEAHLAALERERESLRALGVLPVAVLDRKANACHRIAARLRLGYPVLADPRGVIGAQFNALDPDSHALAGAWFVLARDGRVCALAHESWPDRPWSEVASAALGRSASRSASFPGN